MSLYALGASFGQRSVPPRDVVARFVRERLLGDARFTGDLDELNRIRVRAETVNELLDDAACVDRSVWVVGSPLDGRFATYAHRFQRWIEVDTAAHLARKGSLVVEGGFDASWERVEQRPAESFAVEDVQPGSVVLMEGAGDRVGWSQVAAWLVELASVSGVDVVLDLPSAELARAMNLCRSSLKGLGWALDVEVHFAEREALIVAGGVEIASGMPPFRVVRLRAP